MSPAGRVALVTGGTRGIGRAITERLVADGVQVAAGYASNTAAATELRDLLADVGPPITIHPVDVSDQHECKTLVADVLDTYGRLDYLVNNAGTVTEQKLVDITAEDWTRQLSVNLNAAFFVSQAAIAPMLQQGYGRVVNVGSVTAAMGSPVQIAYGAAKAGLQGLTRSLARSVARKGITVNCVIPGSIATEMPEGLRYTNAELVTSLIPMARWGRADEVAHAVVFLLDDRSSYITGSVVTVDGGMSMGA